LGPQEGTRLMLRRFSARVRPLGCRRWLSTVKQQEDFQLVTTLEDFAAVRRALPADATVGLVPTMGALHAGHLSLVTAAKQDCDVVVGTVFVNPAQFGPNEDFDRYPRSLDADVEGLRDAGVDIILAPPLESMYRAKHRTFVVPEGIVESTAEAGRRPGFFRGVCTVVAKLFNIVQPHKAFFGQKDGMQCSIVRNMVLDLNMPVQICVCPTVREADGLAMSSRNQYLTAQERAKAGVVYQGLRHGLDKFRGLAGQGFPAVEAGVIRAAVKAVYDAEPMVAEIEYISVADGDTFAEVEEVPVDGKANLSTAVKVGKVRLIDNLILE